MVAFRDSVFLAFIHVGQGTCRSYHVRAYLAEQCAGETTVRVTITSDVVRHGASYAGCRTRRSPSAR
ncbi:hypothetical protein B0293_28655 [Amycolatopsis azurea DSM 43854]|uniref:Uncharacterized protein n=1 Tax=Amycolatopsis azurea DSM 43854 TaxID=1238180 RepID=A0ABX3J5V7_9PSEU|nr:hypothetical protein B0293_28655 [Amycolatopsis azurea DSM 43854]